MFSKIFNWIIYFSIILSILTLALPVFMPMHPSIAFARQPGACCYATCTAGSCSCGSCLNCSCTCDKAGNPSCTCTGCAD